MTNQGQADALSAQLGVSVSVIQEPQWDTLMQAGVVVTLHIGRWRAEKRRNLGDMGIVLGDAEVEAAWSTFLDSSDLGAMKLLPVPIVRAMNSKENAARAALRSYAIKTRWGYFLPIARFPEWLESDRRRERDYLAFRSQISGSYDEIRQNARRAYLDAAKGVYWEQNKKPVGSDVPWVFREEYCDKHMASFIGRAELSESIFYQREIGFLPLPSMLAREMAERDRILSEAQLTREQRELLKSLNADIARYAYKAKQGMIMDFLTDIRKELSIRILEVCADVEAALRKNNRLPPKNLLQIRNLIETIEQLDVTDDEMVKTAMTILKTQTEGKTADAVDAGTLVRKIREVSIIAKDLTKDLATQIRNPRDVLRDIDTFVPLELGTPPDRARGDLNGIPEMAAAVSAGRARRDL
jgi:hypothetical protein